MNATNPIQIDGKSYDRYSLNLAITGRYLTDGSPDASIAMRLIPTRLDGGEVIQADAEARGISIGSLAGAGEAPDRVFVFDSDNDTTYLGYLLYSDLPATGSIYDAENWEISRTIFNPSGTSATEASATGAWSSRASLSYS